MGSPHDWYAACSLAPAKALEKGDAMILILLWLLGVPLGLIILLWLLGVGR
jgi:hypothetical protein